MRSSDDDTEGSLISVARAVRTRGLKGEIVAELLTDFPERFDGMDRLVMLKPGGERSIVELEDFWFQNDRIILKLAGCDNIEAAGEFTGCEFCVNETERVPLAPDEYYDFELEDCIVRVVDGQEIGRVKSILKTGGTEILVVTAPDSREVLIPLAESIVIKIDTAKKEILVDPPEGLLELS